MHGSAMTVDLTSTPSFRLDGKRALVTGGGRGIGLAAASALARRRRACDARGAHAKRDRGRGRRDPRARRSKADALVLDVTDVDAVQTAIAARRAVRHPGQQCRHQPPGAV